MNPLKCLCKYKPGSGRFLSILDYSTMRTNCKFCGLSSTRSSSLLLTLQSRYQSTQQTQLQFVPNSARPSEVEINRLQEFVSSSKKLLVLTGAGLSTESGIPDYRSKDVGLYARSDRRPVQIQEFLRKPDARQKYWARNFVGWPNFAAFKPNENHLALSMWEEKGKLSWLVTQNVDALHTKTGNRNLTELHGCAHRVHCLSCNRFMTRWDLQELLTQLNPNFDVEGLEIMPDRDVFISDEDVKRFVVPPCQRCGGVLKPDVTFFGDNVQRAIVDFVFQHVAACDSVLIAGSSLYVYSGYRFALRAKELGKPLAVVNIGPTRADHIAALKLDTRCGLVLPHIRVDS